MASGKYHHHIGLNIWAGVGAPPTPENVVGLKAFSVVYPTTEALQTAVAQVKEIGSDVTEENELFIVQDPSQNTIKLTIK